MKYKVKAIYQEEFEIEAVDADDATDKADSMCELPSKYFDRWEVEEA